MARRPAPPPVAAPARAVPSVRELRNRIEALAAPVDASSFFTTVELFVDCGETQESPSFLARLAWTRALLDHPDDSNVIVLHMYGGTPADLAARNDASVARGPLPRGIHPDYPHDPAAFGMVGDLAGRGGEGASPSPPEPSVEGSTSPAGGGGVDSRAAATRTESESTLGENAPGEKSPTPPRGSIRSGSVGAWAPRYPPPAAALAATPEIPAAPAGAPTPESEIPGRGAIASGIPATLPKIPTPAPASQGLGLQTSSDRAPNPPAPMLSIIGGPPRPFDD